MNVPQLNRVKAIVKPPPNIGKLIKPVWSAFIYLHISDMSRGKVEGRRWITMQGLINLFSSWSYCGVAPGLCSAGNTSHGSTVWYPSSSTEMQRQHAKARGQNTAASLLPLTVINMSLKFPSSLLRFDECKQMVVLYLWSVSLYLHVWILKLRRTHESPVKPECHIRNDQTTRPLTVNI